MRENRMHGSTGRGWKRSPGHRASPSPYYVLDPRLWFLTFDKPETLSDNDVRLPRPETHPRNGQKSHISHQ